MMESSEEYATLVSCTDKLEIALKGDQDILHFLEQEGYIIPDDVSNPKSMLSAQEKAGLVVAAIKNKVCLTSRNYQNLLKHFHTNERVYGDIITILEQEYNKLSSPTKDQPSAEDGKTTISHCSILLSIYISTSESITIGNMLTESIRGHFADLTVRVMKRLKTINIDVDDFRVYLTSRFGYDDFISSISSVSEMINAVTRKPLWNYYNYHALERIIESFGKDDSEMIGWMEEYKTRLTAFKATTKISDYIKDCTDDEFMDDADGEDYQKLYDKKFYRKLSLKLRESKSNILKVNENCLSYIDELWTSLSDQFLLPPLPNLLEKIRNGCIEVTWIVPITIARTINMKATSKGSIEFYRQKNIVRIMMNDKTVFDDDNDIQIADVTEV